MAVAVLLSAAVSLGSTLFLVTRLVLYAVLVAAAWIGIIEGDPWGVGEPVGHVIELPPWEEADAMNVEKQGLKASGEGVEATEEGPLYGAGEEGGGAPSTGHGLTEGALQKHDRKEQAGRPRRRPHYTPSDTDSIGEWSIWDMDHHHHPGPHAGESAALEPAGPRPGPVMAGPVPSEEHSESSEDETGGKRGLFGRRKKKKKPLIPRKIDKWFLQPYEQQYERIGYIMYKGFNKLGKRFEVGLVAVADSLETSIDNIGIRAIQRLDLLMRKWIMFFAIVAGLTFVLVPMPGAIQINIQMGG